MPCGGQQWKSTWKGLEEGELNCCVMNDKKTRILIPFILLIANKFERFFLPGDRISVIIHKMWPKNKYC